MPYGSPLRPCRIESNMCAARSQHERPALLGCKHRIGCAMPWFQMVMCVICCVWGWCHEFVDNSWHNIRAIHFNPCMCDSIRSWLAHRGGERCRAAMVAYVVDVWYACCRCLSYIQYGIPIVARSLSLTTNALVIPGGEGGCAGFCHFLCRYPISDIGYQISKYYTRIKSNYCN